MGKGLKGLLDVDRLFRFVAVTPSLQDLHKLDVCVQFCILVGSVG